MAGFDCDSSVDIPVDNDNSHSSDLNGSDQSDTQFSEADPESLGISPQQFFEEDFDATYDTPAYELDEAVPDELREKGGIDAFAVDLHRENAFDVLAEDLREAVGPDISAEQLPYEDGLNFAFEELSEEDVLSGFSQEVEFGAYVDDSLENDYYINEFSEESLNGHSHDVPEENLGSSSDMTVEDDVGSSIDEFPEDTECADEISPSEETSLILGQMYDDLYRQRITPKETGDDGEQTGVWLENTFYPDDTVVPEKHNPERMSYGEVKEKLEREYSLKFDGITYKNGYADFSSVSVAKVDLAEIVDRHILRDLQKNPEAHADGINFTAIYKKRARNFDIADEIATEKKLAIPGLKQGYTKADLRAWRKENRFTWDESFDNGYILVPSVIHGNISHTGLVGIGTHGQDIELASAQRHIRHSTDTTGRHLSEEDAIISISELENAASDSLEI